MLKKNMQTLLNIIVVEISTKTILMLILVELKLILRKRLLYIDEPRAMLRVTLWI